MATTLTLLRLVSSRAQLLADEEFGFGSQVEMPEAYSFLPMGLKFWQATW